MFEYKTLTAGQVSEMTTTELLSILESQTQAARLTVRELRTIETEIKSRVI